MCDLCTRDGLVVAAIFKEAASAMIKPPRTAHDAAIATACMLVVECQRADADPTNAHPMARTLIRIGAEAIRGLSSDDRPSALHFLSTLRRIVASAERTLGVAKHVLHDPDAEDRAPGLAATAQQMREQYDASSGLAAPPNPFGFTRPAKGGEHWN